MFKGSGDIGVHELKLAEKGHKIAGPRVTSLSALDLKICDPLDSIEKVGRISSDKVEGWW